MGFFNSTNNVDFNNVVDNDRIRIIRRDDYLFKSTEYTAEQTDSIFIEAPGAGKRIIIKALTIHTSSTSGDIKIYGIMNGNLTLLNCLYATKSAYIALSDIYVETDENTAITVTTTTGNDNVFISMNYIVVDVV